MFGRIKVWVSQARARLEQSQKAYFDSKGDGDAWGGKMSALVSIFQSVEL